MNIHPTVVMLSSLTPLREVSRRRLFSRSGGLVLLTERRVLSPFSSLTLGGAGGTTRRGSLLLGCCLILLVIGYGCGDGGSVPDLRLDWYVNYVVSLGRMDAKAGTSVRHAACIDDRIDLMVVMVDLSCLSVDLSCWASNLIMQSVFDGGYDGSGQCSHGNLGGGGLCGGSGGLYVGGSFYRDGGGFQEADGDGRIVEEARVSPKVACWALGFTQIGPWMWLISTGLWVHFGSSPDAKDNVEGGLSPSTASLI
ncbi:hypothetical protein RchiOBHm_Chr5g0080491 [Rosa chinensis]|uniref:Uncharacterized protein n=1 Tax=Rosa chinensis TaxID=74649 RepID=A0A2P6QMR7_ROSCH|nr:hypothetical protein RchiOBHm_Chr5g0080491 [Rosa chinensis]